MEWRRSLCCARWSADCTAMEPVPAARQSLPRRSWLWPPTQLGAEPGDLVEVEPSVGHNIGTSVVVFLLPCVGLGVGYVLGQALLNLGDLAAMGTAVLGLVAGFVPAFLLNRAMTRSTAPEFSILKHIR